MWCIRRFVLRRGYGPFGGPLLGAEAPISSTHRSKISTLGVDSCTGLVAVFHAAAASYAPFVWIGAGNRIEHMSGLWRRGVAARLGGPATQQRSSAAAESPAAATAARPSALPRSAAARNRRTSGAGHTRPMQDLAFGVRVRSVRVRHGMRQFDVAIRAGVSDATVSRIERGHIDSVSVRALRAVASALEIRVDLTPRWRGGDLERAVSARHARLAEAAIRWLAAVPGWVVRPEVSFSIYGERGIIDLLAWHEDRRALLVIELKTEIVDVGETIGTLDRKARLAGTVAADLGWAADSVSVSLIVADGRTNRRRLSDHAATFRAALPDDGRRLRGWLRKPVGRVQALTFLPDRHPSTARPTGSVSCRVRRRRGEPHGPG